MNVNPVVPFVTGLLAATLYDCDVLKVVDIMAEPPDVVVVKLASGLVLKVKVSEADGDWVDRINSQSEVRHDRRTTDR